VADAQHHVVGTAGHVDHGKTSLVRALTGVDCDRLPEEKARGITIELGFASWRLGGGVTASVVDVPGHERFVRTMVAGAAGIDLVVLVVAADDGVMPQTREHLAVCELLGVTTGVIAITKADLVDDDMIELVREDVAQSAAGTFLEGAEAIVCSSHDGRGLDALGAAVARALEHRAARPADGPLFMPVDRVFTRPGFGTVVTGTLVRGKLEVGQELDALPDERGGLLAGLKVRGLHVHDQAVQRVVAASRVAVNLRGDGVERVKRGAALASPGWQRPTSAILAEVRLLPGARPLERREPLSLHLGTREVRVTATAIEGRAPVPGGSGYLRLVADAPFAAFHGQRLVLRRPDLQPGDAHEPRTVGGGSVVDPHPSLAKGSLGRAASQLFSLEPDARSRARALVAAGRERGVAQEEASRRLPPGDDVAGALASLVESSEVCVVPGGDTPRLVASSYIELASQALADGLRRFHAERPLLLGAPPRGLGALLGQPSAHLALAALASLTARGEIIEQDGLVRLRGHDPSTTPQGAALAALLARYEAAGLSPPSDDEARAATGLDQAVFRDGIAELRRRGALCVLTGLPFSASALAGLRARVLEHLSAHPELSTADFKLLCGGVSRKYAIPLLEWLDAEGLTRRQGETRIAGHAAR
jgi:selenocysteine-specific elongation factor